MTNNQFVNDPSENKQTSEDYEVNKYIENYQNDIRCSQNIMEFVDEFLIGWE